MWCDNCALVFPLRHGAMVLVAWILCYNFVGAIFLFKWGEFFFFDFPEAQIYGGIGMAVAGICALNIIGYSNSVYMWMRVCFFVWPIVVLTVAVRASVMMFQLSRQQGKIIWECNNGGQLWGKTAAIGSNPDKMPGGVCSAGFHSLYIAFVLALVADFLMQMYAYFLCWRFMKRIEHSYRQVAYDHKMMMM